MDSITLVNDKYAELTGYSREELEDHFDTLRSDCPGRFSENPEQYRRKSVRDPTQNSLIAWSSNWFKNQGREVGDRHIYPSSRL